MSQTVSEAAYAQRWLIGGRPGDRRFHVQVMACPKCGPNLRFQIGLQGVSDSQEAVAWTVEALHDGARGYSAAAGRLG